MRIGDVIAERFELQALAGSGGMGAVYRARDLQTGLPVALKSLHDPGGRHAERFLREAQVLATLNHPNIVRYVAHGRTQQGELYMAMEWIEGQSLSERIADLGGLGVAGSLLVTSQLASALAFAHARGIIHRDIKPSNVFVLQGALVPKLLDFGIARLAQAARLTSNGMMLGTPGYMAPEQARGAANVTARADVFSLGCLLFKCLAARPPYEGTDIRALMAQVLFEPAPRLSSLLPDVPAPLDDLVARMLAKEASLRPADGAAVLAELRAIAVGVPGADSPAFDVPEAVSDAELQWICAVLARAPRAPADAPRVTPSLQATQLAVPVAHFPDPKRPKEEAPRHASAFELPQAEEGAEVSPEIGTVMDSAASAPAEVVDALRPYDAEVDQLADGSLLTTLGDDADPAVLAVRAVRCALALQRARPQLRVVIATGRALRADHPGVGPALDRAAGLLRTLVDGPPGIRLDVTTAQLVRGRFAVDVEQQPPALAGEADPLAPAQAPLRGRERELSKLFDFAEQAQRAQKIRWSLLVGAPGVGLTRLVKEVRAAVPARAPGVQLWCAAADPAETHTPFSLLRRVLQAAQLDPAQLPFDSRASAPELVAGLARLLADAARARPALLVIDDVDRADPASLALLARALPAEKPVPISVLALGRRLAVSRLEPLGVSGALRELEPLPEPVAAQVVADRSGGVVAGSQLEEVVRLAAGNPWMLRALVDGGTRLYGYPEPALARAAARLEPLGPEARRVLRTVALWQPDAGRGDLGALLGGAAADPAVNAQLELLVRGGWLLRSSGEGLWNEARYQVADPLVAAAAVAQFTESDRLLAHRLAAARLEQQASPDAARIAWHWEQAGQPARAVEPHRRAAASALANDELERAARHADRGLAAGGDPALREALLELSAEAHLWLGELGRARQAAHELASGRTPGSAPAARGTRQLALAAVLGGDAAALTQLADALLKLPVWAEPPASFAAALLASALEDRGDAGRAQALAARLPARPEDAIEPVVTAARLHVDASRAFQRGEFARAHPLFRAAGQALAGAAEGRLAALAQLRAAQCQLAGNLVAPAEAALRKVQAGAAAGGLRVIAAGAAVARSRALFALGQLEEAGAQLGAGLALAEDLGLPEPLADALALRAEQHLAAARFDAADADLARAAERAPSLAAQVLLRARRAEVRAARGDASGAAGAVREALAQLDALGEGAGQVALPVRAAAAELLLQAGLRDLGRAQLEQVRVRLAGQLQAAESPWREALAADPDVQRAVALAAQWLA